MDLFYFILGNDFEWEYTWCRNVTAKASRCRKHTQFSEVGTRCSSAKPIQSRKIVSLFTQIACLQGGHERMNKKENNVETARRSHRAKQQQQQQK